MILCAVLYWSYKMAFMEPHCHLMHYYNNNNNLWGCRRHQYFMIMNKGDVIALHANTPSDSFFIFCLSRTSFDLMIYYGCTLLTNTDWQITHSLVVLVTRLSSCIIRVVHCRKWKFKQNSFLLTDSQVTLHLKVFYFLGGVGQTEFTLIVWK